MNEPPRHILLTQRFLPEQGGSIRWMYEVYRRWPARVRVITHDYYGHPPRSAEFPSAPARPPSGDHAADANLDIERLDIFLKDWGIDRPDRVRRYIRMARAVRRAFLEAREAGAERVAVHAVHAVPEVACLLPMKMLVGDRLKILCYAHGEEINACRSSRQLALLMKRAHGIVDVMLANSRYTLAQLDGLIDPAKVRVMNPGVDVSGFDGAAEAGVAWRRERGLEGRLVVATVGRLDPRKNQSAVLEAVARLALKYPNLTYVLGGEGRMMTPLREAARRRGIADRVMFLGLVDGREKLGIYGGCDVFAMPAIKDGTDVEGFGMVFLEANICGKPVLAGDVGGQPDAVEDGRTGLIVDGTNLDAVTASLERLISDAALRKRLGEAGRTRALSFDWPAVVERTARLVEEIGVPCVRPVPR